MRICRLTIALEFVAIALAAVSCSRDEPIPGASFDSPPATGGAGGTISTSDGSGASIEFGGSAGCIPKTCNELGTNCGPVADGCLGIVQCGTCPTGTICGGSGQPSVCGAPPCSPKTCADQDIACGPAGDGCGQLLDCGTCTGG